MLNPGDQAPSFELNQAGGGTIEVRPDGKPVILAFFSTDCETCRTAIPSLNNFAAYATSKGGRVLAISQDNKKQTLAFLENSPCRFPILTDRGLKASLDYDPERVPAFFLLDGGFKVVRRQTSFNKAGVNSLAREMCDMLGAGYEPIGLEHDGIPDFMAASVARQREIETLVEDEKQYLGDDVSNGKSANGESTDGGECAGVDATEPGSSPAIESETAPDAAAVQPEAEPAPAMTSETVSPPVHEPNDNFSPLSSAFAELDEEIFVQTSEPKSKAPSEDSPIQLVDEVSAGEVPPAQAEPAQPEPVAETESAVEVAPAQAEPAQPEPVAETESAVEVAPAQVELAQPEPVAETESAVETAPVAERVEEQPDEEIEIGDGLPMIEPLPEQLEDFIAALHRNRQEVLGVFCGGDMPVTVEFAAQFAARAGCVPEQMHAFAALVRAAADPAFNLRQFRKSPLALEPLVILNGPVRTALGINSGAAALAGTSVSALTLGRAFGLLTRTICAASRTGEGHSLGHPGRLSYVLAENEESSPWEPLAVELGLGAGPGNVTLLPAEAPVTFWEPNPADGLPVLAALSRLLSSLWNPRLCGMGDVLIALCPAHARALSLGGMDKAAVRRYLFDHAVVSARDVEDAAEAGAADPETEPLISTGQPAWRKFRALDGIRVIVAGADAAQTSAVFPTLISDRSGGAIVCAAIS